MGFPVHLNCEENIRRVGSKLGMVDSIHYKKNNLALVEVCVIMDSMNPNHNAHNVVLLVDNERQYRIFVREVIAKEHDETVLDTLTPLSTQAQSHIIHSQRQCLQM